MSKEIQSLDLLEEIQRLTRQQFEHRAKLKVQLASIVADEEVLWKTRGKQHFVKRRGW